MDPWIAPSASSDTESSPDLELHKSNNPTTTTTSTFTSSPDNINSSDSTKSFFFEDDFQPPQEPSATPLIPDSATKPFSKLPDSDQYLAALEKKLEKVQKATGKKEPARILQGLSQTKESCMIKLLSNSISSGGNNSSIEEFLADEVKVNLLLKKLAPERQAISAEELIHLLTADQLELTLESNTEEEEDNPVKPEK